MFTALLFLFVITAAGVVPCGGPKKSPRTSSIVQVIFSFWSFVTCHKLLVVLKPRVRKALGSTDEHVKRIMFKDETDGDMFRTPSLLHRSL